MPICSDGIQDSSTFDLANDCFRFVTGYFEVINSSAPHIYHSALAFAPQKSMVRGLYESYAHPFVRVVHGLPTSWNPNAAAITRRNTIRVAARSPCDRFIAITWSGAKTIDVLDSATLQRLQTLEFPQAQHISMERVALTFSPDSRTLTCFGPNSPPDQELVVVSWDLQTGGVAGVIRSQGPHEAIKGTPSITYSANGRMIGVRCRYSTGADAILVFDVASGIYVHSHSPTSSFAHTNDIWTHGESLRFITVGRDEITIWEVGFTSDAVPTEIKTFSAPEDISFDDPEDMSVKFLPDLCRLAIDDGGDVIVWDAHNSNYLLRSMDTMFFSHMSFSSDGRFFACQTGGWDVYLWKESPKGYILHGILVYEGPNPIPLLSRNGESIVIYGCFTIRLWHTKGLPTPSPNFTTPPFGFWTNPFRFLAHLFKASVRTFRSWNEPIRWADGFDLDFSPDGMLAVVAMLEGKTVAVLDLDSGVPRLTIDTGMVVHGVRVIGNVIAAIGGRKAATSGRKIITWDLPTGDRVPHSKATLKDSTRTIHLRGSVTGNVECASITPGFRHVALVTHAEHTYYLYIYNGSTGKQLARHRLSGGVPHFAPGGCDLYFACEDRNDVLRIGSGGQVLQYPSGGDPWTSSRGHRLTNDWWIVDSDEKRLLMLPPLWQSPLRADRVWKGQFLALVHVGPPEPIILELNQ